MNMLKINIKKIFNLFSYLIIILICILQAACSGGITDVKSNSQPHFIENVNLGAVTTIPLLSNTKISTAMIVNNNTSSDLYLESATIIVDGKIINARQENTLVDVTSCNNIVTHSHCAVIITPPNVSGSLLINMVYANSLGVQYNDSQLITYTTNIIQNNGFIYVNPTDLINRSGNNTLSIPLILGDDYSQINTIVHQLTGATSKLNCPDDQYKSGTMCTLYVTYMGSTNKEITTTGSELVITATKQNNSNLHKSLIEKPTLEKNLIIPLTLISNTNGSLVSSANNVQINPVGLSTPIITLFNNGNGPVTDININGLTPINIISGGTSPCAIDGSQSLSAGGNCTFQISVNASAVTSSGSSKVSIIYNNGNGQSKNFSFSVYYTTSASPQLTLTSNGWFVDTLAGSVNYQGMYVLNSGNVTLNKLQFNNITQQVSAMSYGGNGQTCVNGQSLAPAASCIMAITYAPPAGTSVPIGNSITISPSATYTDSGGNILNYTPIALSIKYSANSLAASAATAVVAGDYGAISTTNTPTVTAWTIKNATPFGNAPDGITRMINTGPKQIIGMGATTGTNVGKVYEAYNGMIWTADNSPIATTITGLTYDIINGYLLSTNTTTLYTTTALTGASTSWTPRAGWFNIFPFNLYNFGSVYIAPQNQGVTGQMFATSITPITSPWTTGTTSPVTPRVYQSALYDGNQYCLLSTGRAVSCTPSAGFSTGTTWTQNTNLIFGSGNGSIFTNNSSTSYVALIDTPPYALYTNTSPALMTGIWSSPTTAPNAPLVWLTYGVSGGYVAVSAASPGLVWSSVDNGVTWIQQTSGTANNPANRPYAYIYYDGSNYWASGVNLIKQSPDGVNWFIPGIKSITNSYNGNTLTYFAAGNLGTIQFSTDLITWTQVASPTSSQLNGINCFNANTCYAVGYNGTILFSSDGAGLTWSAQTTGTTGVLNAIACSYNNCVAVGSNGLTLNNKANNSTTWITRISGTTQNLNAITFNNFYNIYIAVGNNGTILTSADGITWASQTSGTVNNLNGIACGYSIFGCMAVGNSGSILTSPSGVLWTARTSAGTAQTNSVTFYNGVWMVAQNAGAIRTSLDGDTPILNWTIRTSGMGTASANMNFNSIISF